MGGGMSLGDMIKIGKNVDFGTLYIKPAFVFVDGDGHAKLQFEADPTSALAYLYDSLCKEMGISWNYHSPSNSYGVYTNCAMHAAGDRASYGCGPDSAGTGGFCPQMTLAYGPRFMSEEHAAAYLYRCNTYVDYWRSLYPSGVAVGTSGFFSEWWMPCSLFESIGRVRGIQARSWWFLGRVQWCLNATYVLTCTYMEGRL